MCEAIKKNGGAHGVETRRLILNFKIYIVKVVH